MRLTCTQLSSGLDFPGFLLNTWRSGQWSAELSTAFIWKYVWIFKGLSWQWRNGVIGYVREHTVVL